MELHNGLANKATVGISGWYRCFLTSLKNFHCYQNAIKRNSNH